MFGECLGELRRGRFREALTAFDAVLIDPPARPELAGVRRAAAEFLWFGIKEARACLFAGLFFASVLLVPDGGAFGIPRYDLLLIIALAIQALMLWTGLETAAEFRAICVFHVLGMALELFKTSSGIRSWSYPEFAWTKLGGVPLFSGFMYAAVGSYILQAWRILGLRVYRHPPFWMAALVALAIYANFFSHHFIGDWRWYIAAFAIGLYARTFVVFRPMDRDRRMPLPLAFVLIGFFVWVAENISTFLDLWKYPDQLSAWSLVHVGKWSSWSLLVILSFTIVARLRHLRARVHVSR